MKYLLGVLLVFLTSPALAGWNTGTGGTTGGGVRYSHPTDCPNAGYVASPLEACVDQDNGALWTCKAAPTAGVLPDKCDVAGDWLLGSSSSTSGVTTFNTRAGVVSPASGDYTATQVTSTATGTVAATNVQAAIAELETEKQGTLSDPNACPAGQYVIDMGPGGPLICSQVTGLQVTNTPGGNISATTVQGAITELDLEKQPADPDLTAFANLSCSNGSVATYNGTAWICGTAGGVTSFNARSGVVVPVAGDYTAAMIPVTPGGNIAATSVAGAITELDVEKQILDGDLTEIAALNCNNGEILKQTGGIWACGVDLGGVGGAGDVVGPTGAVDNTIARYDGSTGKTLQGSGVTIDDSNNLSTAGTLTTGVGSNNAGVLTLTEGTAPSAAATNTIQFQAPPDVTTPYDLRLPAAPATGVLKATNAAGIVTTTFAPLVDADIPDTGITMSNYLLLAGGTMTGPLTLANGTTVSDGALNYDLALDRVRVGTGATSVLLEATLSHATDCTSGGITTAVVGELCMDLDDGRLWGCNLPAAAGSATVCDSPADWKLSTGNSTVADGDRGDVNIQGGVWNIDPGAVLASEVTNTPSGTIAATNVQNALNELDTEKQVSSPELTQIAATNCPDGQILKQTAGTWVCAVDATGGGGVTTGAKGDISVVVADADWQIIANQVTNLELADMAATTIKGRVTGTTGDPQDLNMTQVVGMLPDFTSTTRGLVPNPGGATTTFLRADGTWAAAGGGAGVTDGDKTDITVSGSGATWTIDNDAVTAAKMANMANGTIRGRITAGTGDPEDLTGTQTTTLLDTFTTSAKGLAPASGGGTSNYLRADGTWAIPPGGAGSYLPLTGGTLTGLLTTADVGVSFGASGSPPTCGTGYYGVYFKSGTLTKCIDGVETALDTDTDTDTGVHNMQEAYNGGKTTLVSSGTSGAVVWCLDNDANGTCNPAGGSDSGWQLGSDAATGPFFIAFPNSNNNLIAPDPFDVRFVLGTTLVGHWDHTTKKLTYDNAGRPLKSVEVQGIPFGACAYTEENVTGTAKPKVGVFTCTDIDTDGFDFRWVTPLNWDAGTVAVRLNVYSTNATPSGSIVLTCSGRAVSDGDVIQDRSVTGEQAVTMALATQYKEENATSSAITINDTPVAGDQLYMHCDVDATATSATMTNVRINAMAKVFYTVTSESE